MTGLLVAVVMLLFVCVPSSAPWADTASGFQNRVAQADNSQIVPPDPEQPAEAPAASSAADAAAEVLRLRGLIGEKRDEIEAGRSAALEQVEATYRANLAAIEPKDMFETELEYQQRDAREKSEVELQRARDVSGVHREHDLALRDEVEPMVQQVRELLSRADIVPQDAIDVHLENYDPERKVFTGSLKIDSGLVQTNAGIYLAMEREDAKMLWKNRESLKVKIRLSMAVRSLDIEIEEFWLGEPELGIGKSATVIKMSKAKSARIARILKSTASLYEQTAGDINVLYLRGEHVQGWLREYNRLLQEAKQTFKDDPFVQALQELKYFGSSFQLIQSVREISTAVLGLSVYLESFNPSEAFKASASALHKWAEWGSNNMNNSYGWTYIGRQGTQGWIREQLAKLREIWGLRL